MCCNRGLEQSREWTVIPHERILKRGPDEARPSTSESPLQRQILYLTHTGCPKKLRNAAGATRAPAQSPLTGSTCYWQSQPDLEEPVSENCFFCSCFLLTTKQDLVVPYHIHGKIWPHCTRFWLGLLGSSSILSATFFGTTCIPPSNLKGEVALEFNYLKYYNAPSWLEHGICFPSTMLDKTCSIPFSTGAGLFKAGPAELERDNHRSLLHHCHSLHCGAEVYIPKTNK